MAIITIRGQLGSGAPTIGALIAKGLGYDYVDREIIGRVATTLQRHEDDVAEKEMPRSGFLGRIAEALQHSYAPVTTADGKYIQYLPPVELPLDDSRYLAGLESVVKELAGKGSIVVCGRGSQFILKDRADVFHVLVIAPLELRVKRVMEESKAPEETSRKSIALYDSSRREFIKRYFHSELEDPKHYDLIVNTERIDYESAASIVTHAVQFNRASRSPV